MCRNWHNFSPFSRRRRRVRNPMGRSVAPVFIAVALLSGCAGPGREPATPSLPPLAVDAARQNFFKAHPGAAADLFDAKGDGFRIFRNGRAEYRSFGALSDLRTSTYVSEMSGNRICLAAADQWSGACLDLFGNPEGTILVQVEFGNGARRSYQTQVVPASDFYDHLESN